MTHSNEIIELIKRKRLNGESYEKIAKDTNLSRSNIKYMVKNNYNRKKKNKRTKKNN